MGLFREEAFTPCLDEAGSHGGVAGWTGHFIYLHTYADNIPDTRR